MSLQKLTLASSGLDVHYYRAGRGEPLLYLHHLIGIAGFEPALGKLAEHFDVIAPYAPGWGPAKDDLEKMDPGPLDLTLHFCDVLDALGVASAHVAGISIGGWMAAELAAIAPQRVQKLVLVNPLGLWLEEAPGEDPFAQHPGNPSEVLFADKASRKKYLVDGRNPLDALVEELLNLRAGAKFLWPIPDTGVKRRLPRIKAQTLVVTSEHDAIVPAAAYGAAWQSAIPGAKLARLAGAGHLAELEQPERFAALVTEFVASDRVAAVA
ncbi:MAG: alpha/beta hydrolase [Gammaproteobacteria bacterium]|nr:alpha/beta hydrolase [Gammaproteobacteria bacterium]MBI5617826.1 alpha/beta hydrolase [Gammaproteobacteria bacterium]